MKTLIEHVWTIYGYAYINYDQGCWRTDGSWRELAWVPHRNTKFPQFMMWIGSGFTAYTSMSRYSLLHS